MLGGLGRSVIVPTLVAGAVARQWTDSQRSPSVRIGGLAKADRISRRQPQTSGVASGGVDLQLFARVLWRFRFVVLVGFGAAVAAAFLLFVRVELDREPDRRG